MRCLSMSSQTSCFCTLRASRQTGKGSRPTHSLRPSQRFCAQRADGTSDHGQCQSRHDHRFEWATVFRWRGASPNDSSTNFGGKNADYTVCLFQQEHDPNNVKPHYAGSIDRAGDSDSTLAVSNMGYRSVAAEQMNRQSWIYYGCWQCARCWWWCCCCLSLVAWCWCVSVVEWWTVVFSKLVVSVVSSMRWLLCGEKKNDVSRLSRFQKKNISVIVH